MGFSYRMVRVFIGGVVIEGFVEDRCVMVNFFMGSTSSSIECERGNECFCFSGFHFFGKCL